MGADSTEPVVIYASWRGLFAALFSPAALILAGGATVLWRQTHPIALTVLSVGLVFALGVLLDFPRRTEFDRFGLVRRCFLRRHVMTWDSIDGIGRAKGSRVAKATRSRSEFGGELPTGAFGGLVAERGRRRYLLADRAESRLEFDALVAAAADWAPDMAISAVPPPVSSPPTDLYRWGTRRSRGASNR